MRDEVSRRKDAEYALERTQEQLLRKTEEFAVLEEQYEGWFSGGIICILIVSSAIFSFVCIDDPEAEDRGGDDSIVKETFLPEWMLLGPKSIHSGRNACACRVFACRVFACRVFACRVFACKLLGRQHRLW